MSNSDNEVPKVDTELPEWVREKLTKANNEAAHYRTEKNKAVEAARAEVADSFSSKISELEAQIASAEAEGDFRRREVERLKVTIESGISADKALSFADLLKGDNEDELRSHAEELKKLFVVSAPQAPDPAVDPSQGQGGGNHLPLNGDPLLEAVTRVVNRRNR